MTRFTKSEVKKAGRKWVVELTRREDGGREFLTLDTKRDAVEWTEWAMKWLVSCGRDTLGPDDVIRPCVKSAGHVDRCDGGRR